MHRLSVVLALAFAALVSAPAASGQNFALQLANTGTDGYGQLPSSATLAPPSLTIEAWITYNEATLPAGYCYPTIIRKNMAANSEEYNFRVEAGNTQNRSLKWAIRRAAGPVSVSWAFPAGALLNWTHVAGTYDGTTVRLFVNGAQVASTATTGAQVNNGGPVNIGVGDTSPTGAHEIWNGTIDELRLWSTARTAAEITAGMFQTISSAPNLMAAWHLDNDVVDSSGNANHGTIFGTGVFVPATLPVQEFQTNVPRSTLTIDATAGNVFAPTVINRQVYICPAITPVTGTVAFSSNLPGGFWDIFLSSAALVGATGGGITLVDGQFVNLDVTAALIPLNGFFANPLPPGFPGTSSTGFSFGFSLSAAADFSVQAAVLDPGAVSGLALSQATEYHAALLPPPASVAGPTADNAITTVNVVSQPNCWTAAGIPFFGVNYTQLHVSSNGRVNFVTGNTSALPTVASALTSTPMVGLWTDLNPALGGNITVTNPAAGIVRVNYNNVPYAGEAATVNSFAIVFDTLTGAVTLDGLTGVATNPQSVLAGGDAQFLGISRGNTGATNLGSSTLFSPGGSGLASNATHMWYDFYTQVAGGAGKAASLVPGTLNGITFLPAGGFAPNYDWLGY